MLFARIIKVTALMLAFVLLSFAAHAATADVFTSGACAGGGKWWRVSTMDDVTGMEVCASGRNCAGVTYTNCNPTTGGIVVTPVNVGINWQSTTDIDIVADATVRFEIYDVTTGVKVYDHGTTVSANTSVTISIASLATGNYAIVGRDSNNAAAGYIGFIK